MEAHNAIHAELGVYRFLAGRPSTREETYLRLLRYVGHWSIFGYGMFAVVDRQNGKLIGETGLAHFGRELGPAFDNYPEAGWIFSASAQGKGLAFEAAVAAHGWLSTKTGKHESVCIIDPQNTGSLRLASKLGYSPFGSAPYSDHDVTMLRRVPAE
jgi:RimJ/RimL family protein N-acetyltransferase